VAMEARIGFCQSNRIRDEVTGEERTYCPGPGSFSNASPPTTFALLRGEIFVSIPPARLVLMTWSTTTKPLPPGNLGTGFSLTEMANMVRRGVQSMRLRPLATRIIARCPGHDFDCEIKALFEFVRDTIRFTKDPVDLEMIGESTVTLQTLIGDCDDKMELLAELLGVVGHISRWGIASYDGHLWNHVFVEVSDPYDGRWITLDPTGEAAEVGERPTGAVAFAHHDIWPGTSGPSDRNVISAKLTGVPPNVGMPTSPADMSALGDCGCGCKGGCGCKSGNVGTPTLGPDDGDGAGYGDGGYFDAMGLGAGQTPSQGRTQPYFIPLDPTSGRPVNPFLPIKNPQSGYPEIMGYPDLTEESGGMYDLTVANYFGGPYGGGQWCQFGPGDIRPGSCESYLEPQPAPAVPGGSPYPGAQGPGGNPAATYPGYPQGSPGLPGGGFLSPSSGVPSQALAPTASPDSSGAGAAFLIILGLIAMFK
jgi:hypothetical protein